MGREPRPVERDVVEVVEVAGHDHLAPGRRLGRHQLADHLGLGLAPWLALGVVGAGQKVDADDRHRRAAGVHPHPQVFGDPVELVAHADRRALVGPAERLDGQARQHPHVLAGERVAAVHQDRRVAHARQRLVGEHLERVQVLGLGHHHHVGVQAPDDGADGVAVGSRRGWVALPRKCRLTLVADAVEQELAVEGRDADTVVGPDRRGLDLELGGRLAGRRGRRAGARGDGEGERRARRGRGESGSCRQKKGDAPAWRAPQR